jgi:hypothetical protein
VKFRQLKVACKSCPFRREDTSEKGEMGPVRLRVGRVVGIHNTITNWHGGTFSCHKTVHYSDNEDDWDDGGRPPQRDEHHCAGAIGYVHNLGSDGAQVTKFAVYASGDGSYADYGPPEEMFSSLQEWKEACDDYEEADTEACYTVGPDCIAPAGYMTGGGVIHGTESADGECAECGDPCCSACQDEGGLCGTCHEYADDA